MRLLHVPLALLLALPAFGLDRDHDEQVLFVRGTIAGATMRVAGATAADCEVKRPTASTVLFVVRGARLKTEGPYRTAVEGLRAVTVMGQEQTGADESRVLVQLDSSRLQPRVEDGMGGVHLLLEDPSRVREAAEPDIARAEAPARPRRTPPPAPAAPAEAAPPPSRAAQPAPADSTPAPAGTTAPVRAAEPEVPVVRPTTGGMVAVPAGTFTMGTPFGDGFPDESPEHAVAVSAFEIDAREVTVGEFEASPYTLPRQPEWNWGRDQPVVNVTHAEAAEYCEWAGKRLPTEAEWERAARGPDGRQFPWGPAFNVGKVNSGVDGDGHAHAAPVGSFREGASPYGALDMAGNVWEWVADWYDDDYYARAPGEDPQGPERGTFRVVRGGSFEGAASLNVRAAVRMPLKGSSRRENVGFRCAR